MNDTQDSDSVNIEDQFLPAPKENDCAPDYEQKLSLRPESAESTDSERAPKLSKNLKSVNQLPKSRPTQTGQSCRPIKLVMNVSGMSKLLQFCVNFIRYKIFNRTKRR